MENTQNFCKDYGRSHYGDTEGQAKKREVNLDLSVLHWFSIYQTYLPPLSPLLKEAPFLCISRSPPLQLAESISYCTDASETMGSLMQVTKQCLSPTRRGYPSPPSSLPVMARRLGNLPILLHVPFMVKLLPAEFWLFPHLHELCFTKSPEYLHMGEVTAGSFQEVLESKWDETPRCLPTVHVGKNY